MTEQLPAELASGLTQEECEFVYNLEVLRLPARKAASLAGVSYGLLCKPHIVQARDLLKRELRGHLPSKEDIAHGMLEAVDRARLMGEPMTEIIGYEKVAKLLGYDAPQKIDINITASVDVLRQSVKQLSTADLARMVPGASDIIDADFYEVR